MAFYEPEPIITPEDDEVFADCGHNVYEGENLYEVEGKWICPDCFKDMVNELTLPEWAELMNIEVKKYE